MIPGLLPQPHGFQGLLGIEVRPNPDRLAIVELDNVGPRRLDLGVTLGATPTHLAERHDSMIESRISEISRRSSVNASAKS